MSINDPTLGPVTERVQFLSLVGSVLLLSFIIRLIRKGSLKAGYSLLWFLVGGLMLLFSLSTNLLFWLSGFLGVYYAPAALFSVLLIGLILLSIHFSVEISKHERRIKRLSQENSLLKNALKKLKKKK